MPKEWHLSLSYPALFADVAINLAAIAVLAYAIYFRRYHRRSLLIAYVCFNIALFVVVKVLTSATSSAGLALGLGLFGALSIIRLRSEPLTHVELSYFFSALALAIVNGVGMSDRVLTGILDAILLVTMFVVDRVQPPTRAQRLWLVLDDVYPDDGRLRAEVERRIGAEVLGITIEEIDYVRDTTRLRVLYAAPSAMVDPLPLPHPPAMNGNGNGRAHAGHVDR
jgi:hypothetical protein